MSNPFGFAIRAKDDSPLFLPLRSVHVNAEIIDVSTKVELKQIFANVDAIDNTAARYIFPVPANAAVCAFRMETADGTVVRGVVKELVKAQKEYKDAINKGKWAGLLEQVTGDVFVVSVGAIPAGRDITVHVTYVEELSQDNLVNQVRFTLPTYIADRYGAAPSAFNASQSVGSTEIDIHVNLQMASPIQRIHSPSHAIEHTESTIMHDSAQPLYQSIITSSSIQSTGSTAKEFILTIQAADLHKPRCIASADHARNSVAMSLTLVPQFGIPQIDSQEYVFVIDRSGSMGGLSIEFAKDALTVLLRSLPTEGTYSNIVSFGTTFSTLWEKSQEYNAGSLKIATDHVESMSADMGGTEIESVLRAVFNARLDHIPTAVFVLTDGEVWDVPNILSTVRTAVSKAGDPSTGFYLRVFTLGIGMGASTSLCRGLARTGNGLCYMVADSEDIPSRCSTLLKAARVPPIGSLWGMTIDWGHPDAELVADVKSTSSINLSKRTLKEAEAFSFFDASMEVDPVEEQVSGPNSKAGLRSGTNLVKQAPASVPDIYPFNRFIVSAILLNTTQIPDSIVLRGKMPAGEDIKMNFQVQTANPTILLHTLVARRLIADLQDGNISSLSVPDDRKVTTEELIKSEVVRLSEEYQLASEHAAFLAIEERVAAKDVKIRRRPRDIDSNRDEAAAQSKEQSTRSDPYNMDFFREPVDEDETRTLDTRMLDGMGTAGDFGMRGLGGRYPSEFDAFRREADEGTSAATAAQIRLFSAARPVRMSHTNSFVAEIEPFMSGRSAWLPSAQRERIAPAGMGACRTRERSPDRQELGSNTYDEAAILRIQLDARRDADESCLADDSSDISYCSSRVSTPAVCSRASLWELDTKAQLSSTIGDTSSNELDIHGVGQSESSSQMQEPGIELSAIVDDTPRNDSGVYDVGQWEHPFVDPEASNDVDAFVADGVIPRLSALFPELDGSLLETTPFLPPFSLLSAPTPVEVARMQNHNGSFTFDGDLLELLNAVNPSIASLEELKEFMLGNAVLHSIHPSVWATVLVAAMMTKRMGGSRDVWGAMWIKAKEYVLKMVGCNEVTFARLLEEVDSLV